MTPDIDLNFVSNMDDATNFMNWVADNTTSPVAVDTETTGLSWWHEDLRLVQFGNRDSGWAVPMEWYGLVREFFARHTGPVIFHNAKFDMHFLPDPPEWERVHDTRILHHLHDPSSSHSLKTITSSLWGSWAKDPSRLLKQRYGKDWYRTAPVDDPIYWGYGVLDTILTRRLYDHLEAETRMPVYDTLMAYTRIMSGVEERGLHVDIDRTESLWVEWSNRKDELAYELERWGITNPNANRQIENALSLLGWTPESFTKTGDATLDKAVLLEILDAGGEPAEVVELLLEWKKLNKWLKSYLTPFWESEKNGGVLHPNIRILGARTGRDAVSDPPLQQLPAAEDTVRGCIIPPEGHVFYAIDYANQEPRLLAHFGRSEALLDFFSSENAGSLHDYVAQFLFGDDYTPQQRAVAKMFGLARSYGAGAATLAERTGMAPAEVERFLNQYDKLVGLADLQRKVHRVAAKRYDEEGERYVRTYAGRKITVHPNEGDHKLVNGLMQGSGADVLHDAVIRLDEVGLADYISLVVHDEVLFAFPRDEAPEMAQLAATTMHDDRFRVPLPVDVTGPMERWKGK